MAELNSIKIVLVAALLEVSSMGSTMAADAGLGRVATQDEVTGWSIDVFPDGEGLPPGVSTVAAGKEVYMNNCAACHGERLEGGAGPALAGGKGSLSTAKPFKTVGSYWPYSSTLFDYIRRAMPFSAPQSLTNDEVYGVSGYILHVNGLMAGDGVVDAKSLIAVEMPNRDAFYVDNRPDVNAARCMSKCLPKTDKIK